MANRWVKKAVDPEVQMLRGGVQWKTLRRRLLSETPVCVVCQRAGRHRLAEEVHHIIPAKKMIDHFGQSGFFDERNLVCLCVECHDKHENAYRNGLVKVLFGRELIQWQD